MLSKTFRSHDYPPASQMHVRSDAFIVAFIVASIVASIVAFEYCGLTRIKIPAVRYLSTALCSRNQGKENRALATEYQICRQAKVGKMKQRSSRGPRL